MVLLRQGAPQYHALPFPLRRMHQNRNKTTKHKEIRPTRISAYACKGQETSVVLSSSAASIGSAGRDPILRLSCWQLAGIPVTGSSLPLSCAIVQEGDIRRSEEELSEIISVAMSAAEPMVAMLRDACVFG